MSMMILAAALMGQAPVAQPAIPQAAQSAAAAKEKKICKVDENESSSRLRKRVCMTQTEWDRKESGVVTNDLKNMGAH